MCDDSGHYQLTSRRSMLKQTAIGFGNLALTAMLAKAAADAGTMSQSLRNPLAPKQPHFRPRAKRVIFLFMKGGPSHVDTFDYKPSLQRDDGRELPFAKPRIQFAKTGKLLGSPWRFKQYGDCGISISELFPHVAHCADDICFLHSVHGTNPAHGGASLKLHTGSDNFVRPSMGSWITYGLGTQNENLPGLPSRRANGAGAQVLDSPVLSIGAARLQASIPHQSESSRVPSTLRRMDAARR